MADNQIGFWVHGMRARDLAEVESFLTGDAHDKSKVQWFDGKKFHTLIDIVENARTNYDGANVFGEYPTLWRN